HGKSPRIGPWLALDALNEESKVGLAVIRHHLAGETDELALDRVTLAETARCLLSQPFPAWVLVDLRSSGIALRSLVDLNYIEFVTRFWEIRRASLEVPGLLPDDIDVATAVLAQVIPEWTMALRFGDLVERFKKAAGQYLTIDDRQATAVLRELGRANLLGIERRPEPALADAPVEWAELRFETFWAWRLARQTLLAEGFAGDAPANMVKAFEKADEAVMSGELRNAMLVFSILLLDQAIARQLGKDRLIRPVVEGILRSGRLARSSVWLAVPKGSLALQREVTGIALRAKARGIKVGAEEPNALFAFMYFAQEVLSDGLKAPAERFRLLEPWYPAIGAAGLSDYFLYLAQQVFDGAAQDGQVLECMHRLAGCEPIGITEALAEMAVERLGKIATVNVDPP